MKPCNGPNSGHLPFDTCISRCKGMRTPGIKTVLLWLLGEVVGVSNLLDKFNTEWSPLNKHGLVERKLLARWFISNKDCQGRAVDRYGTAMYPVLKQMQTRVASHKQADPCLVVNNKTSHGHSGPCMGRGTAKRTREHSQQTPQPLAQSSRVRRSGMPRPMVTLCHSFSPRIYRERIVRG